RNYTNAASDAEAILTVQVDSAERAQLAQEIMDRHDAIDVDERGSSYDRQNISGTAAGGAYDTNATARTDLKDRATIPVVEESLKVGKEQVERGGARIRSRVVEKPVEETVRLREEHVVVNRRPVNREITDADRQNFRPGEMEITERAEVPVVGKQARVVEEVEVGKNVTEREETVRDTVRSTDVDVEQIDKDATTKARRAKP
ncbi:MAG TPA: YsnF/AvaK domain-containing protein, partial [Pyrinomonadaceae bacterium]|nr:YsnF/AvaK domain-containing protein [Pyrinomonadaceae bacterium]